MTRTQIKQLSRRTTSRVRREERGSGRPGPGRELKPCPGETSHRQRPGPGGASGRSRKNTPDRGRALLTPRFQTHLRGRSVRLPGTPKRPYYRAGHTASAK